MRKFLSLGLSFPFNPCRSFSYHYVAGDAEGKGLVETVKEKATDAYVVRLTRSLFYSRPF